MQAHSNRSEANNSRKATTVWDANNSRNHQNIGNTSRRRDLNSCREDCNIEALTIAETPGMKQQW